MDIKPLQVAKCIFLVPINKQKTIMYDSRNDKIITIYQNLKISKKIFKHFEEKEKALCDNSQFRPQELSLVLTRKCNLRCRYCCANGGSDQKIMPAWVAKKAIDLLFLVAKKNNYDLVSILYTGGEPTLAWRVLKYSFNYAKGIAKKRKIKVNFSISTNGTASKKKIQFLAKNFHHIQISLDGVREINDLNRIFPDGTGSFSKVSENLEYLKKKGFTNYGIRGTVTKNNIRHMPANLEFFVKKLKLKAHGLSKRVDLAPYDLLIRNIPAWKSYSMQYCKLLSSKKFKDFLVIKRYGLGCNLKNNLIVGPYGDISSCCYEIIPSDKNYKYFVFGKISKSKIVLNLNKASRKYSDKKSRKSPCKDCIAKVGCAGECSRLTLNDKQYNKTSLTPRCDLIRFHFLEKLKKLAD